jgi:transposase
VAVAAQVGCERRTVARVVRQPIDHAYQRRSRPSRLAQWDAAVTAWLDAGLPIKRMLELVRADGTTPYTGSPATWYRYVHRHQQARAAAAAPVIRFEGLPGEFLQVDWGEAHVPLGIAVVRRVFLAARLKYSRTVAVRWGTTMVLERLLRGQLAIFEEVGGVPVGVRVRQPEDGDARADGGRRAAVEPDLCPLRHRARLPPRAL